MIPNENIFRLEDILGTRVPWRLLRILLKRPYLSFSPTVLAANLQTSRASVLRVLGILGESALIRKLNGGRYQANTEHEMIRQIWGLFMLEHHANLQPSFRSAIDMFFKAVEKKVMVFIVFGSVSRGLATEKSDIDICVVGENIDASRFDFLPYRFDIHNYKEQHLKDLTDFVVLDSLLNGIVLKGDMFIFNILKDLRTFPKEYLLYRLNKAKQFLGRADELQGEARDYYYSLARTAIGEVTAVLHRGTTVSKHEINYQFSEDITSLESELAREGDQIWLI